MLVLDNFIFFLKKIKFYNLILNREDLPFEIVSSVYLGIYERAEIKFIMKYFEPINTIDLGSGLGLTTAVLKKKFYNKNFKTILVEANNITLDISRKIFKDNKIFKNSFFLNLLLLAKKRKKIKFIQSDIFLSNKIITSSNSKSKYLNRITTLNNLLLSHEINNEFQIIVDIEGEELKFNSDTFKLFKNCKHAIIELHTNIKTKKKKFIEKMYKYSKLKLIDQKSFTLYFSK